MVEECVENCSARGANITFADENATLKPIILMKKNSGRGFRKYSQHVLLEPQGHTVILG
jgi:hypothetical protein